MTLGVEDLVVQMHLMMQLRQDSAKNHLWKWMKVACEVARRVAETAASVAFLVVEASCHVVVYQVAALLLAYLAVEL